MNIPLTDLTFLIVCFILAIAMTVEGIVLLRSKKKIIPLTSTIMLWITIRSGGDKEEIRQKFAKQNSPDNIHSYAIMSLISGVTLIIACIFYLNWLLSH